MRPGRHSCLMLIVLAVAQPAYAGTDVIERCRQAGSLEARVACLEAALLSSNGIQSAEASGESDSVPSAAAGARPDDAPLPGEVSAAMPAPSQQELTVPEQQQVNTTPQQSAVEELGAEQVKTLEEREAALASAQGLEVVRYDTVPYRRLEVHLANGQVWRQINGDTQTLRASLKKNQTVDIEESSLGGYKLRLNEMRRTIRVRRVR